MLRFNGKSDFWYSFSKFISIHPMLRFNNVVQVQCYNIPTFQYILCYGSTHIVAESTRKYLNFNTSYVTVQLKRHSFRNRNARYFNTSYVTVQQFNFWRDFLWKKNFNTSYVTVQLKSANPCEKFGREFQYILCYGSTRCDRVCNAIYRYFNTSYVTVQL